MTKHIDTKIKDDEIVPFYNTTWFWKLIIPALMAIIGGIGATIAPTMVQTQHPQPSVTLELLNHKIDSLGEIIGRTNIIITKLKATQDSIQMVRTIREQVLINQQNPSFNERMIRVIDSSRISMIKSQ